MTSISPPSSLINDLYETINQFRGEEFELNPAFNPYEFMAPPKHSRANDSTQICIHSILCLSYHLAFQTADASPFRLYRSSPHTISIIKSDQTDLHNRVSDLFLDKILEYSHVYLYYSTIWFSPDDLFEESDSDNCILSRIEHPTLPVWDSSIYRLLIKKFQFIEKIKINTLYNRETSSSEKYEITQIIGTRANIKLFCECLKREADTFPKPKVPLKFLLNREVTGAPLESHLEKKRKDLYDKAVSFTVKFDRPAVL